MDIYIIGAGMAGLLAARMLKNRGHHPVILEQQPSLPNNHRAVLRFRTNVVSEVTGIPFNKVNMIKCTVSYRNPVADCLAYAQKVTGTYSTDRSIVGNVVHAERWIAPSDFISQLAKGLDIKYEQKVNFGIGIYSQGALPIISTIPMPKLIPLLNYPNLGAADFDYRPGLVIKAHIKDCYAFASMYVPDPDHEFSRVSITGDELSIEVNASKLDFDAEILVSEALHMLGISGNGSALFEPYIGAGLVQMHPQQYSKIMPIDDDQRKRFMAWATDKHNIYSLGRFATWRPGLLLDDLVNDIKRIEGWIVKNNNYEVRKAR